MNTFGQRLRHVLDVRQRSIASLALDSGYSERYIERLIRGEQNNPTIFFVDSVARALSEKPGQRSGDLGAYLAGWSNDYDQFD